MIQVFEDRIKKPIGKTFEVGDRVEATERYRKESLKKGANIGGVVVSSNPNYTEMLTDGGLHSHIRTYLIQKVKSNVPEAGDEN